MTGCYGRTLGGSPCELPAGHYPATKHLVTYDSGSWFTWTDEAMREFARIACNQENARICTEEHRRARH